MKRTHAHRMVAVALGLLVLVLSLGSASARGQLTDDVASPPMRWVPLYRVDGNLYVVSDLEPKLLVKNVPLSPLAILQMGTPKRLRQVPLTPDYVFHSALLSPTNQDFVYLERTDSGQNFNLWRVQADGQRKLLLSQRYQNGASLGEYMVPVAWLRDDVILLHETLMQLPVALWQLSLADLSLQRQHRRFLVLDRSV